MAEYRPRFTTSAKASEARADESKSHRVSANGIGFAKSSSKNNKNKTVREVIPKVVRLDHENKV